MSSSNIIRQYETGKGFVLAITNSLFGELDEKEYVKGTARYREGADLDHVIVSKCFDRLYVNFEPKYNLKAREYAKKLRK